MKLRIHQNSIRLRLSRSEVARLGETGLVQDSVTFASGAALSFSLEAGADCHSPHAELFEGRLRVLVPQRQASNWVKSDEVGIEGPGAQPAILIEKDFQCVHRQENDPEAYPNPLLN